MEEEEKKERFTSQTAAQLLSKPEPKIEWLIDNIWTDHSRGMIAGNPGVGKTWLALDMLISVASGKLCLGKFPVKQGPVLLIEEEASELNLARRLHAMARARGLQDTDLSNFHLLTRQFVKIPKDIKNLFHFCAGLDIKLIVFDSLRRFHAYDENSSSEMQPVLDSFAMLGMMTEASVVLIHHLAKSSEMSQKPLFERLRGSSDFWAWRDCLIGMEGEEDPDTALCSFQFRDAESQEPIIVKRCVGEMTGAIGLEVVNIEESEEFADKSALIVKFLSNQSDASTENNIFKAVKGRRQEFLRIFKRMAKLRMVIKNGSGWVVPENAGTSGN